MGGGYEGGALSVLLELFIVETPERAPAPSTTWGPQRGRVTVSEEESSHLTPNPWAPRSWTPQSPNLPERNVCCLRAPPTCNVLLQRKAPASSLDVVCLQIIIVIVGETFTSCP